MPCCIPTKNLPLSHKTTEQKSRDTRFRVSSVPAATSSADLLVIKESTAKCFKAYFFVIVYALDWILYYLVLQAENEALEVKLKHARYKTTVSVTGITLCSWSY